MRHIIDWPVRHNRVVGLAFIAAVVAVAYSPALRLGFYGDDWIFYDLAGRLPLAEYLVRYFDPRVQTAWYRPVQGVLFRGEYLVFGANPLGYHLLNILVHLANCFWLYALLARATGRRRLGFTAALFFATLPTAALSVFWPGVIDALETFFYLAAIWFWWSYLQENRPRDYALAFGAFLGALFTKEIGVTLPLTLLLVDRCAVRKPVSLTGLARRYLLFALTWVAYFPIEYIVTRRSVFVSQIGYTPDAARLASNLLDYAALLAFPWASLPPLSYLWLLGVVLLLGYVVIVKKQWAWLPVVSGAALAVLPVAAFPFVASRFLYLPLAGTAILFAAAFVWLWARVPLRLPLLAALAGVVLIGGVGVGSAAADFGEYARVSRVTFRNVSQAHPTFPEDTHLYFVDPPVPGTNLSGMFLWRYGPRVTVGATDISGPAKLREHAAAFVYYFDEQGEQREVRVEKGMTMRVVPSLPVNFGDSIRLEGFEPANPRLSNGESIILFLYWRGLKRMDTDYAVSVNLVDPANQVLASYAKPPRHGDAPTSGWVPGEPVIDTIQMPVEAPAGAYRLEIGLYDAGTMQPLPVLNSSGEPMSDRIVLEPYEVREP